jgi:hypothetical protein
MAVLIGVDKIREIITMDQKVPSQVNHRQEKRSGKSSPWIRRFHHRLTIDRRKDQGNHHHGSEGSITG